MNWPGGSSPSPKAGAVCGLREAVRLQRVDATLVKTGELDLIRMAKKFPAFIPNFRWRFSDSWAISSSHPNRRSNVNRGFA